MRIFKKNFGNLEIRQGCNRYETVVTSENRFLNNNQISVDTKKPIFFGERRAFGCTH